MTVRNLSIPECFVSLNTEYSEYLEGRPASIGVGKAEPFVSSAYLELKPARGKLHPVSLGLRLAESQRPYIRRTGRGNTPGYL